MSSRDPKSRPRSEASDLERELTTARDEIRALQTQTIQDTADIAKLRAALAEAYAHIGELGQEPAIAQATESKKRLVDAEAARAAAERSASKALRDLQLVEEQLASVREELGDLQEQATADAAIHTTVAHELAELRREAEMVKARNLTALLSATAQLQAQITELTEVSTTATARADHAETELRAAESRVQQAESDLRQAKLRATAAEARVTYLDKRALDHGVLQRKADEEYAQARRQIVALETRLAALDTADKPADPAANPRKATPTASEGAAELEHIAAAGEIAGVVAPSAELVDRAIRMAAALADKQVREAARRVEIAEERVVAANTIAKAMAKDVAEALRRAVDAELRVRNSPKELEAAHRTAEQAEAERAKAAAALDDAERRVAEADARASQWESELRSADAHVRRLKNTGEAAVEAVRRELAAERSTAVALADCKRQLDGELAELRTKLAAAISRTGAAERRNAELELEIAAADNVRAFAAETEREIAQLQRQLHDARSALAEVAAERDRWATAELDTRGDREPTNPVSEQTVHYRPGLMELFRRTAALEDRVIELERDNAHLREQLARTKRWTR